MAAGGARRNTSARQAVLLQEFFKKPLTAPDACARWRDTGEPRDRAWGSGPRRSAALGDAQRALFLPCEYDHIHFGVYTYRCPVNIIARSPADTERIASVGRRGGPGARRATRDSVSDMRPTLNSKGAHDNTSRCLTYQRPRDGERGGGDSSQGTPSPIEAGARTISIGSRADPCPQPRVRADHTSPDHAHAVPP